MHDFQKRVVDEQTELNGKLIKLIEFTLTDTYRNLPNEDRQLLDAQAGTMATYNSILAQRIVRFVEDD